MQHERLAQYRWHLLDAVQLTAIAFTAIALIPAGAHLAEISMRLQLTAADYITVQRVQHGVVLFCVAGFLAAAAIGVHTFLVRRKAAAYGWSMVALVGVGAAQIVFWSLAYPISVATEGWSQLPADFAGARMQWEYGFAIAGVLNFAGLLAFVRAVEASRPIASMSILESIGRDAAVRAARMRARALDGGESEKEPLDRGLERRIKAA